MDIVDILRLKVIPKINNQIKVKKVISENLTTITVKLCSLKWIRITNVVTTDLGSFEVASIDYETKIVGFNKIVGTLERYSIINLKPPTFIHGTRITANNEWKALINDNTSLGIPLIWLYESINENEMERYSSIDYQSNCRIYFLDFVDDLNSSVNENYQTAQSRQIREQGVKPMLGLMDEFIHVVNSNYDCDLVDGFQRRTFSNFGNENLDGTFEHVLDESLGGVEIRPTFTVFKKVVCC